MKCLKAFENERLFSFVINQFFIGVRCVTSADGERIARDHSATFLETSSKDGDNVLDAMVQLSRYVIILKYHF